MFRKRHPPAGSQPGTMIISDEASKPAIRVMDYMADHLNEYEVDDVAQLRACLEKDSISWVDVQGLGDEQVLKDIGETFSMHPLALADVVNIPQRPKVEPYDGQLFAVTRMALYREGQIVSEQVSLMIGRNYLLTFQELHGDVFDPVRARIRQGGPVFRSAGPGYLAYAILDAVIDGYYPVLEVFGERLDALEDELLEHPVPAVLQRIHRIKRELLAIRKAIWPQREAISALVHDTGPLISDEVRVHLRDCYDHCIQIIDVIETYRELAGSLMDMYLSSVGNRQNEVMKVLTIMATIFIPLTFLAGIYGMNFEYMPELHLRWAYPGLLLVMIAVAAGMLAHFRLKGWLGNREREPQESEQG
ncbi:MAG: magnesium/cobalt transporter CorA [Phycisphaerales bacterium]|nr:MAG: magnesium/cobalt transporter CorA [Phycisphaerales bacterium]